ncbi:MAG: TerC family protein [Anaerolineae bacterium]
MITEFVTAYWAWIAFGVLVTGLLALDLGVFHRKAHAVPLREAAIWSIVWIAVSLAFNAGIWMWKGSTPALEFLTAYIIEKSLSVDNIFVFVLIFSYFGVPAQYQHRVLFWGVLGAIIMRGILIMAGVTLIERFHWVVYLFGAFLVFTGIRMARHRDEKVDLDANWLVRLARRVLPVTSEYVGEHFFTRQRGVLFATPLLLVLLVVESTDLVFAVDSIPAVLAISQDPFIVFTSNIFAILGLRALYFVLAGVIHRFYYLKAALSVILSFVGVKMLIADIYKIPVGISLSVIAVILAIGLIASLIRARRLERQETRLKTIS